MHVVPRRPNRELHRTAEKFKLRHYQPGEEPSMNGAAIVAEILKRAGTDFLSCYPRNPLIEACAPLDLRPILCRQDRVGVGMVEGHYRTIQRTWTSLVVHL